MKILKLKQITKENITKDLIAGLSVAMVSIPEGIGFAMIVGVNPIYGLYTGIVATIIGAMSTGSKLMVVTLTNTLAISAASALVTTGNEGSLSALFMLTVMIGVIQFLMGVLRMGSILRFISHAVMTGFVFGSALLIILGQLENITGYYSDAYFGNEITKFYDWMMHITVFDIETVGIGFVTIVVILLLKRIKKLGHAAYAIALVLMTIFVTLIDKFSISIVGDHTSIPQGLPQFILPDISMMSALIMPAIAIALIGLIDAAGVMAVFGKKGSKNKVHSQDFIGQGLANMIGGLFSGLPSGGSFSRTALNVESGAKSRIAAICAGTFTLILVLTCASFVELIPYTALAGLLVVIGFSVLFRLRHDIVTVWYTSPVAMFVMLVTFFVTLVIPLYWAIFVGILLSFVIYIFDTSMKVRLVQIDRIGSMRFEVKDVPQKFSSSTVVILAPYGNLFFAVVNNLPSSMPSHEDVTNTVVILRLRERKSLNSTAIKELEEYAQELQNSGNTLMLSGVDVLLLKQLKRTGTDQIIGKDNIFIATNILEESTDIAWKVANKRIKKDH